MLGVAHLFLQTRQVVGQALAIVGKLGLFLQLLGLGFRRAIASRTAESFAQPAW